MTEAVLVHAIGRTPLSMLLLAARLRRAGIRCHIFGYAAGFESFERITARLARRLRGAAARPYIAIGHSLGGVLLRAALDALPAEVARPRHLFLLGSPSRGPRGARRRPRAGADRPGDGDCGQLLAEPARMAALPRPTVPTTVIAGTRGWRGRWSPFAAEENDGVVAVGEVAIEGLDLVRVPAWHTFLMNSREVVALILGQARARP
jgi:pimeloyl-ACP methyl ester carboxylesterase